MRLIAHRGFASVAPENTLRAVDSAASIADWIEVDVRRCGSGELVVIHDATVDRVTDQSGTVSEYTSSELRSMCVLGTDEGIPTLAAVLRTIPEHVGVNVELKEAGIAVDALDLITSLHPRAVVSSFSRDILSACTAVDPTTSLAYITEKSGTEGVETATELGCAYLHLSTAACTVPAISKAHRAGIQVNAWTVDTAERAASLGALGIDGLIADRPGILPGPAG
ncbi:MAG: glycerophosphodiester phosphodiesterase [Natronomonas sp.]